jgi:carbonic anhydrase-like protein
MNRRFVTAINCIDGRAQIPAADWLKLRCGVDFVDMITEPGADKVLTQGPTEAIVTIRKKVEFSFQARQTGIIAVVAHHGCLAHPVSKEQHWEDVAEGVRVVTSWGWSARVFGLWVNEWGSVDLVCDTQERSALSSW